MIQSHTKRIQKTAHFYTLGKTSGTLKEYWIVCHCYGQLASSIIRKFEGLEADGRYILAPEGLSRFYWPGAERKVVASWMTSKDRLDEIDDYSDFLSGLLDDVVLPLKRKNPKIKLNLFGFSQGCATLVRWIMRDFPAFDHLILWGGFFPEDLEYTPYTDYWNSKKITFVCGDQDQFLTPDRIAWHDSFLAEQQLMVKQRFFKGKHVIPREELKELLSDLRKG